MRRKRKNVLIEDFAPRGEIKGYRFFINGNKREKRFYLKEGEHYYEIKDETGETMHFGTDDKNVALGLAHEVTLIGASDMKKALERQGHKCRIIDKSTIPETGESKLANLAAS